MGISCRKNGFKHRLSENEKEKEMVNLRRVRVDVLMACLL